MVATWSYTYSHLCKTSISQHFKVSIPSFHNWSSCLRRWFAKIQLTGRYWQLSIHVSSCWQRRLQRSKLSDRYWKFFEHLSVRAFNCSSIHQVALCRWMAQKLAAQVLANLYQICQVVDKDACRDRNSLAGIWNCLSIHQAVYADVLLRYYLPLDRWARMWTIRAFAPSNLMQPGRILEQAFVKPAGADVLCDCKNNDLFCSGLDIRPGAALSGRGVERSWTVYILAATRERKPENQ